MGAEPKLKRVEVLRKTAGNLGRVLWPRAGCGRQETIPGSQMLLRLAEQVEWWEGWVAPNKEGEPWS